MMGGAAGDDMVPFLSHRREEGDDVMDFFLLPRVLRKNKDSESEREGGKKIVLSFFIVSVFSLEARAPPSNKSKETFHVICCE